jgi:hypothetical protein
LTKKIEFNLLSPNLAVQICDLPLRISEILCLGHIQIRTWSKRLCWPAGSAHPERSVTSKLGAPLGQKAGSDPQLLAHRLGHLSGQNPLNRRELELAGVNMSLACGHPAFLDA